MAYPSFNIFWKRKNNAEVNRSIVGSNFQMLPFIREHGHSLHLDQWHQREMYIGCISDGNYNKIQQ